MFALLERGMNIYCTISILWKYNMRILYYFYSHYSYLKIFYYLYNLCMQLLFLLVWYQYYVKHNKLSIIQHTKFHVRKQTAPSNTQERRNNAQKNVSTSIVEQSDAEIKIIVVFPNIVQKMCSFLKKCKILHNNYIFISY